MGTKGLRLDIHWGLPAAGSSTLVKNNIHNLSSASVTSVASVSGVEMGGTAAINMVTETLIYNLSTQIPVSRGSLQESGFQVVLEESGKQKFHPQYIGA
jgi:predicted kinase